MSSNATPNVEIPLFLRKAYSMIDLCPKELGGWTDNGLSFKVYDIDLFALQIIPKFFKHNNWSSFVRQLNFYGFKKVKNDINVNSSSIWEFNHPLFVKGKPHLLSDIVKKTTSTSAATVDLQDVIFMKQSIETLQRQVSNLNEFIEKVSQVQLQHDFNPNLNLRSNNDFVDDHMPTHVYKKRAISNVQNEYNTYGHNNKDDTSLQKNQSEMNSGDVDGNESAIMSSDVLFNGLSVPTPTSQTMNQSKNNELLNVLYSLEMESNPIYSDTNNARQEYVSNNTILNGNSLTSNEILSVVSQLKPSLQERFVDKLAVIVGNNHIAELKRSMKSTPIVVKQEGTVISNNTTIQADNKHLPAIKEEPDSTLTKNMREDTSREEDNESVVSTNSIAMFNGSDYEGPSFEMRLNAVPEHEANSNRDDLNMSHAMDQDAYYFGYKLPDLMPLASDADISSSIYGSSLDSLSKPDKCTICKCKNCSKTHDGGLGTGDFGNGIEGGIPYFMSSECCDPLFDMNESCLDENGEYIPCLYAKTK